MPKKFTFRGKEIEEISKLNLEEFSKMLTSRERRTIKRGFTPAEKQLLLSIRQNPGKYHKTHSREMVIIPEMVGQKIGVHSGKEFVAFDIKPEMIGHRLGEFVITRKMVRHSAPGFGATKSSKYVPLK
jgi:small subunit ribosomal protein S19